MIRTFLFMLALGVISSAESPAANKLLLVGDGRLVVIQLEVSVGDESLASSWQNFLDREFKKWDGNNDGVLTGGEARQVVTQKQLEAADVLPRGQPRLEPDFHPADGRVTRAELTEYYDRVGFDLLQIESPQRSTANRRFSGEMAESPSDAAKLFHYLDEDGSKTLTLAELSSARQTLRRRDLDRDGAISSNELSAPRPTLQIGSETFAFTGQSRPPKLHILGRRGPSSTLIAELLAAYDRPASGKRQSDGRLSLAELGLPPDIFAKADRDGDQKLDFEELQYFLRDPSPEVTLKVRLSDQPSGPPIMKVVANRPGAASADEAGLRLGSAHVEFKAANIIRIDSQLIWQQAFKNMDRDANGYLDSMEMQRFGIEEDLAKAVDLNSDALVYEDEFLGAIYPLAAMNHRRVVLQASDLGRDLFRLLDANGDRRLGLREFRAAGGQMPLLDADADGLLNLEEIPQRVRIVAGRASLNLFSVSDSLAVGMSGAGGSVFAPAWFHKMDRNGDGDIARDEFLGPLDAFDKRDADRDGLLDAQEAAAESMP